MFIFRRNWCEWSSVWFSQIKWLPCVFPFSLIFFLEWTSYFCVECFLSSLMLYTHYFYDYFFASKDGSWITTLSQTCLNVLKIRIKYILIYIKYISQHKIKKNWGLSPNRRHDIVKRGRAESVECVLPLSAQVALHEKLSCCHGEYDQLRCSVTDILVFKYSSNWCSQWEDNMGGKNLNSWKLSIMLSSEVWDVLKFPLRRR